MALVKGGHPGVGKNFPPSSVRDLGLGWPLGKSFASGSGVGGWSASRPLRFATPFSLDVCYARDEVTNLVHFKQSTDVQLVGGLGGLRGRVSDLFPPPSWGRAVSWMCDPPFSLPMRGGVPWRVLRKSPARGWLIAFLLCTCAGISLLRGGLLGGRACLLPGQGAAVLASPLQVAGAIPRGAARFGVYACQIYMQRGSWSHLRWRLLLRP